MRRSRFAIPGAIALAAVTAFLGAPTIAGAAEYGPFSLTDVSQTASWSGELEASPPVLPEACAPDVCDIVKVKVELPEGTWDEPGGQPGGMLVATQPPPDWANLNNFDLYVYGPDCQDGRLLGEEGCRQLASATSLWSVGSHAAWVEDAKNGLYKVVVAPETFTDPPALYDGFVSFDYGLTVKRQELREGQPYTHKFVALGRTSSTPAEDLLPDLVPTKPDNFHIETGICLNLVACGPEPAQQPSCYPDETAGALSHTVPPEPGPLRCLRFDQGEANVGDGPLELQIYPGKDNLVYQRVYRTDGSVSPRSRFVGDAFYHPSHGHFHYQPQDPEETGLGWWDIKLHERLPNGEPGAVKATYAAKGICPLDVVNARFGQRGDGPQGYGHDDPQTCFAPRHQDANSDAIFPGEPYIQTGISVGWSDIYPWMIKDQYIDITHVPDGKYIIVTKQDPLGSLQEKSTANNTARACVEISGITATPCDVPDLQATSLSASNTKGVREGEKVTISATVANTGEGEAAASSTEILLDGTRLPGGLLDTPALAPGESATLSLNWDTRGVKGEHRITATADSGETVEESNEENNAREITVTVRGNKIGNPSFEESSDGSSPDAWSSSGSAAYEMGGSDGLRSVSTEPGGSWTSEAVPVEAGSSYDASVVAAGAGGTLLVQHLTSDGSVLSTAAQAVLPSEVFTFTSVQLTALTGAAQVRVVLLGGLTGKTTFDDVGLFGG